MSKRSNSRQPPHEPVRRRLENTLFDTLCDEEITMDEIVSGVVRMLNYDPHDGMLEVLNLVVRAAGCATPMQLLVPATAASDLQAAIEPYAPAQYPFKAKAAFAHRYSDFFASLPAGLLAGEALDQASRLVGYLVALAELHTRSLRHTASAAALGFARSLPGLVDALTEAEKSRRTRTADAASAHRDELVQLVAPLTKLALARQTDVFASVRELAVAALAALEPHKLVKSLNDVTGSVRLAAVKGVAPTGREWRRVLEIAESDSDAKCRKQALALLAESDDASDALTAARSAASQLILDADPAVRLAAAHLVVSVASEDPTEGLETDGVDTAAWAFLLEMASLAPPPLAAESLARAAGVGFSPLADLLVFDFSTAAGDASASVAPSEQSRKALLDMLLGFGRYEWSKIQKRPLEDRREKTDFFVAQVLTALPQLVAAHSHSDALLARAIRIGTLLDVTAVLRRGLEKEYEAFLELVLEMFHAHAAREVVAAAAEVFAVAGETESPFAGPLRLRLTDELENVVDADSPELDKVYQATALAPFVDLSPLQSAPLWGSTDPAVVALAGLLGLSENSDAIKFAISYLLPIETPLAVQELLKIHTVATMRKTQLDPLPELSREGVAEPVLAAAEAAGI